ncbi:ribosome biogenesis GTPase YqeH [Virgibacillus sp. 179-BFC.A HS]|uniref:Ribosome biogenesis GTPase YqeH n=1 Tax=Tigheibacillus jepli TaxID=3035914 RepID=A0ABU5CI58_9BACI|nr:ribosome biogenesis GTPase YqeH [Virgibacillus sp. 179-BFC.A HS]MDY0405509.1 ribosome biogenesis GTPase YqeH [Virgibacillus sp. 179-BFC.A HS]
MGGIEDEELYCQGCGAKIQTEDPDKAGYTPKSSLNNEEVLCRRCFRLKHYNEIQDVDMDESDFLDMVSSIQEKDGLVVHIIDIFDVNGSLIHGLTRIVGNHPIILVGNKVDLLPKSTNKQKLKQWLRTTVNDYGIKVKDVFLVSSVKGDGIDELADALDMYRNNKDVYVVGATNVGKSTFINRLIKDSTGIKDVITTSYFPGTTLGFIKIALDENSYMVDTPGIVNKQQMAHYVSAKDLKIIHPKKEIKQRVYQLHSGQTLFFGGLARLDFVKGEKQSFICYFSNELPIHRTKLANADALYAKHVGEMLTPPDKQTLKNYPKLIKHAFRINGEKTDIVFPGLGWVSVLGNVTVEAYSPEGSNAVIRKSLI